MRGLLLLALLTAGCRPQAGPAPRPPRPADIYAEAVQVLQGYLRIDTTNPPGNEMRGARYLARILARERIEHRVFDLGGNRANLYAVLRGDGSRRPLVLSHHIDVVPAEPKHWRAPPFSGKVVDGEIYGRGAVDMKGKAIVDLMTMIRLKREGMRLKRDLVLIAVADEEENSVGARSLVKEHPKLIRGAEFLLDEGQQVRIDASGRITAYLVSVGEKAPLWLTVSFSGEPGHGSVPRADTAVNRALRAAGRILARRAPARLLPELRGWLALRLEGRELTGLVGYAGDLERSLESPAFLEAISALDPDVNAALHDTITITRMRGSEAINVIPNTATLGLDCRLLPDTDKDRFLAELRHVIDDPTARIKIEQHYRARKSPADSALVQALGRIAARRKPAAPVIPTLLLCSTDASLFRSLGIQAYGFESYKLTEAQAALGHANDERIGVESLRYGIDMLTELILELNR